MPYQDKNEFTERNKQIFDLLKKEFPNIKLE